jgi:hypothetical protein
LVSFAATTREGKAAIWTTKMGLLLSKSPRMSSLKIIRLSLP